ncbi:MAG: hypothetical protein ACE5DL_02865 [Nitrosopumilaceae archaeon]
MKKFLTDSKMFELDRYYQDCKQKNQPFIKARKNPVDNNYVVQADLITCDYKLTSDDKNNIDILFKKEINFLNSFHPGNSIFKGCNIDKELVWFDGILPERLNNFCESLFDLLFKSRN